MNWLVYIAFILNLLLCGCEAYTLANIRPKRNILKYYTFLQNLFALCVSVLFCVYFLMALLFDRMIPEYVKGLRYVATCGLTATMFIFVVFLSSNSKNQLTEEDFVRMHPQKANFILHYFCPVLSLLSFLIFERPLPLSTSVWTGYAAIPSCVYWIMYLILSITKLWEEPYDFSSEKDGKKSFLSEMLPMVLLPLSFILISYILWTVK